MSQYDELHKLLISKTTEAAEEVDPTGFINDQVFLQIDRLLGFTQRVAKLKSDEYYSNMSDAAISSDVKEDCGCCIPQPGTGADDPVTGEEDYHTNPSPSGEAVIEVAEEAKAKRTRKPRAAVEPAPAETAPVISDPQPATPVETPPAPAEPAAPVVHDDIRKVFHRIKAAVIAAHPITSDDAGVPNGPQRAAQDAAVAALVARGKEILKSFDASNIDQLKAEDLAKAFAALSALK